jgi:large subunit ribosomal protein L44e
MKAPKEIRTHCPKCNTHTLHTLALYKRGKERTGALGARRHAEDKRGYGGQKFPELVRTAKTTKKLTLRLRCKDCGTTLIRPGLRLRKLEILA